MSVSRYRFYLRLLLRWLPHARWRQVWNLILFRLWVGTRRDCLPCGPINVLVWASRRCNKRCNFCHYHGELAAPSAEGQDLSVSTFLAMLEHPDLKRSLRLSFYGGEPLLNPDLPAMIQLARHRGHLVSINTNGRLLAKRAAELIAVMPDLLCVSAYPEDIDALRHSLPRLTPVVPVKLGVLFEAGQESVVERTLQLAADTGVQAVFVEYVCGNGVVAGADGRDLINTEFRRRCERRFGRQLFIVWPAPRATEPRCAELWSTMVVTLDGQVGPCCVTPLATYHGSLFASEGGWNAPWRQHLRRDFRQGRLPDYCVNCRFAYSDPLELG